MACEHYNNGTNAQITFTENNLPGGFCPSTWQDVLHNFILSLSGELPGNYSTFVISATQPAVNDQDKLWLQVDSTNCRPVGFYLFYGGEWVRVDGQVIYGEDTSVTPNSIEVDAVEPNISWVDTTNFNQIWIVKIAQANTGPATLSLPTTDPTVVNVPIRKYGTVALTGLEMLAGMLAMFTYDGTNFQLLNPRPDLVAADPISGVENNSFEIDTDGDGIPDRWVRAATAGAPTGQIDNTQNAHGVNSYRMQVRAVNEYETLTSQNYIECAPGELIYIGVMFMVDTGWVGSQARPVLVNLFFYDENLLTITPPFSNPGTNSEAWCLFFDDYETEGPTDWIRVVGAAIAPSDARYYKIQLQAGDSATSNKAQKYIWFDDVRIGKDFLLQHKAERATTGQWRTPGDLWAILATIQGAGGGAGSGYDTAAAGPAGGGGGGGETIIKAIPVRPDTLYDITIGAGGVGGADFISGENGTAGGDTSFDTSLAHGGAGGINGNSTGSGGAGGSGALELAVVDGVDGANYAGTNPSGTIGGNGGASIFHLGGVGAVPLAPFVDYVGEAGQRGSGGGGGPRKDVAVDDLSGGDGGDGLVILEW